MSKIRKPENKKMLVIAALGIFVVGIGTYIALNGTELLQRFGANAYVPNPIVFATYTRVSVGTNAVENASNFLKVSEIYPIDEAYNVLVKNGKTQVTLYNNLGANKGNTNFNDFYFTVTKDKNSDSYRYLWNALYPEKSTVHSLSDSHFENKTPYYELNNGLGLPTGTYFKLSKLDNNPANCNKSYLKKYEAQFLKADGKPDFEGFWWPNIQVNRLAYPKRAGTYYIADPVCLVPFDIFDNREYAHMVDTRYDTTKNAANYAFQTGNYVIAIFNHPASTQYVFERMYFTDNSAAYNNFSKQYCVIKGSADTTHCTRASNGGYRGIDILKNGRLYNLAGFELIAVMPTKTSLAQQPAGTIVGGPYAFQWWTQTLGLATKHWDFDNVNTSGTDVPHTVPQQATTWKVYEMK